MRLRCLLARSQRLLSGCDAAVKEFENFRKQKGARAKIVEVNRLEEVGDRLYRQCMQKLITK